MTEINDAPPASLVRFWNGLPLWASRALFGVAPVLTAVGSGPATSWGSVWAIVLLIAGAIVLIAAFWLEGKDRYRYDEMLLERRKAVELAAERGQAINDMFVTLIRHLAQDVNLSAPTDRVSIYYATHDKFVMIARYSADPLRDDHGRGESPLGQGVIGDAWQSPKGVIAATLPADKHEWIRWHVSEYGFNEETAIEVFERMPSKSIGAACIRDERGRNVGVLVLESLKQGAISMQRVNQARSSPTFLAMSELTTRWAPQTEAGITHSVRPMRATQKWERSKGNDPGTSASG